MFTNLALAAWLAGTWPYRWWANAQGARAGEAPVMPLFYHRVADTEPNDWTISTADFTAHLDWLAAHFDLVSLEEAQRRIAGRNHRPAVANTFDDGYSDNCRTALPLLVERQIPVTYFVATEFVRTGAPFPHDLDDGIALPPNTIAELRDLAAAGVEIGAHTRTHPDLGAIAAEATLRDEVLGSCDELADWLGRPIRYFAFPYGQHANLNARVFALCREAGLAGVCSAYGGYNFPGDDPFHLQRIHGDPGWLRLANWLTIDPRKVTQERYRYESSSDLASSSELEPAADAKSAAGASAELEALAAGGGR